MTCGCCNSWQLLCFKDFSIYQTVIVSQIIKHGYSCFTILLCTHFVTRCSFSSVVLSWGVVCSRHDWCKHFSLLSVVVSGGLKPPYIIHLCSKPKTLGKALFDGDVIWKLSIFYCILGTFCILQYIYIIRLYITITSMFIHKYLNIILVFNIWLLIVLYSSNDNQ